VLISLPGWRMKDAPSHTSQFPLCVRRENIERGWCSVLEVCAILGACEVLGVLIIVEDRDVESSSYSRTTLLLPHLIPGFCGVKRPARGVCSPEFPPNKSSPLS
jgi:hypothetical protein